MAGFRRLPRAFFRRSAEVVARDLLGRFLVRELDGERLVLRLVEVEAYLGREDPASHAFRGPTRRNAAMFLEGGHVYVYLVYGMHHCVNVVCREEGVAQAVLLRAGEAVEGGERMASLRGLARPPRRRELAGGPGRLCAALAIDRRFDGARLGAAPLRLTEGRPPESERVVRGPRIGVDYAGEAAAWPLRFAIGDSSELSRPMRL